jgi:hypothetical protein
MLVSAAQNPSGVPQVLLDEKAKELEEKRAADEALRVRCACLRLGVGGSLSASPEADATTL